MISERKLEANRRNAAKSTGPRTAEGKDKVRFNAVTHGFTAATVVLPHEDKEAYQHRLEAWTQELKAPGDMGRYLVERMVKISWQLDRADTSEQARLARRIHDAPRLFGLSPWEPAEILFARLLEREAQTAATVKQAAHSRSPRRTGPAGPLPDDSPATLLRALESSSEGCRLLIDEWTTLIEWLGPLGPEGFATSEIGSMLHYYHRALRLLGLRIDNTETGADTAAVAMADPLAAAFLQAWRIDEDKVFAEFMAQGDDVDEDDDDERARAELESYWIAVGAALLKLAADRCAHLRNLLASCEQSEAEARGRLAFEASFDDSPEGERLHRYQERWGRSLLRTLAKIEGLRDRGEVVMGGGSAQDSGEQILVPDECVSDVTSETAPSICHEPCSSEAETSQGTSERQEENCQNKPTEERLAVVQKGLRPHGLAECKATSEHRSSWESDDAMDEREGENGRLLRSLAPCLERRLPAVSPA